MPFLNFSNFRDKNLKFANKMSSSSSSNSANCDLFAKWTPEKPCQCSKENYFTTSLTWIVVQMLHIFNETLITAVRRTLKIITIGLSTLVFKKKDATHEAVQVKYKCKACGHEFHQTYDLTMEGKRKRWGHYGERREEKGHSTARLSFEHVEKGFAQMSENYNLIRRNCWHWAREFYAIFDCFGVLTRS